jgi:hypothetical protein
MSGRRAHLQRCPASRKVRFRDKREATRALHYAAATRQSTEGLGIRSRRQERRAYPCGACNGWHLTSTASWGDSVQSHVGGDSRVNRGLGWGDGTIDRRRTPIRPLSVGTVNHTAS